MEEIHTSDFDVDFNDKKSWEIFLKFKLLHIDHKDELPLSDLMKISFMGELVVHTKSLSIMEESDFEHLLEFISCTKIRSLIINHEFKWFLVGYTSQKHHRPWSLDELKLVSENSNISEVSFDCLDIDSTDFDDFVNLFATMGKFNLSMDLETGRDDEEEFMLRPQHLELLIAKDIRVTRLSDGFLYPFDVEADFLRIFCQLKYLEVLYLENIFIDSSDVKLLINLPIEKIAVDFFDNLLDDNIYEVVRVLSQINSLKYINFGVPCNDHKFSPEEFALFKDLPVKRVETGALVLKTGKEESNLIEFRKIMMQMKIEEINVNHRGRSKFKVKVISHGPGKMYKSI